MKNIIEVNSTVSLIKRSLTKAMSYNTYRDVVSDHVQSATSSGLNENDELSHFTLLNDSRMRRLDKTLKLPTDVLEQLENYQGSQTWIVLTESWCGDAAQALPMISKLAEVSSGISLKVLFRDENPELMDAFLTNGTMSIPKLIAFDTNTNEIVGDWGPRPTAATEMVAKYKKTHGSLTPEFKQELQVWYNKDKGQNIAIDLVKLLN